MYYSFPMQFLSTAGLATDTNQVITNAHLTTIEGYIDGLEALITALNSAVATAAKQDTTNAHLTTIEGYIDGIETLLGTLATSAKQDTIIGHIDGIEALLTTIDTNVSDIETLLSSINTNISDIETLLTSIDSKVTRLQIVDFLDTPLLDAASTTIEGSGGAFLTVVASLAADVKALRIADTTGAFIGVYNTANTLIAIINAGIDGEIPCVIAAGQTIKLRSLGASNITLGNLVIQFLG